MSRGFRVWDNEKHKYVGDCVIEFKIYGVETSVVVCPNSQEYAYDSCHDYYNEGRFVLEQDTGLKDRHGEKIREGDVVLDYYDGDDAFIVKWDEDTARFILTGTDNIAEVSFDNFFPDKDLEVIGNIHENKELLGGE